MRIEISADLGKNSIVITGEEPVMSNYQSDDIVVVAARLFGGLAGQTILAMAGYGKLVNVREVSEHFSSALRDVLVAKESRDLFEVRPDSTP